MFNLKTFSGWMFGVMARHGHGGELSRGHSYMRGGLVGSSSGSGGAGELPLLQYSIGHPPTLYHQHTTKAQPLLCDLLFFKFCTPGENI